ncbi:hypothetical protein B4U80_00330 [Leptotrombidium deliense]|uniref:Bromo domain-containing protein n=1 Tax=Leptotrombidium deliense TaxID=299467 RepID=A0A443SVC4_9ACAR|nr:hypothetical protein B4U80_00330 [Leptotrombidium deliense]
MINANWEQYLIKLFDIHWVGIENLRSPFENPTSNGPNRELILFDDLQLFVKVDVVYHLCEYRLYPIDAQNAADLIDPDSLRLEPIGKDNDGYLYYYFHGTRLYRENPTLSKKIAVKLADYEKRKKKFKSGKDTNNKPYAKETGRKVVHRKCRSKQSLNGSSSEDNFDESVSCGIPLSELKEGWNIVCTSLEDWKSLELKLSSSTEQCELELCEVISGHLLPSITEFFVQKEKEARRKLIEFLPRRGSSRLEAKKLQKEQEEKRLQEESEVRKRKRAEAEERAKMDEERVKQESLKRDRERRARNRLMLIEETAAAIHPTDDARNENETEGFSSESNSSDVYNGNTQEESCNNYRAFNGWHEIDSTKCPLAVHELYEGLSKVIATVMSNRDAWPFKEAVDEKTAPLYFQVIQNPIDLSVIETKIKERLYKDLKEVESDFKLMVNNCETYNGPRNGYTLMAYACWKAFRRAVQKHLKRSLHEDEKDVFIYPPKVTNINPKAAIEARKRKRKQRKGMKALEILAQAAEIAVKDTSSRSSSNGVDDKISDVEDERESLSAFKVHGSTLARYVYTQNNTNFATVSVCQPDANLTFKSLSEWSESLRQSGSNVILPQNTVFVCSSPVTTSLVTNGSANTISTASANKSSVESLSEHSVNNNTHPTLPVTNNQRLVIKLSKCNDGGNTLWQLSDSKMISTDEITSQTTVLSELKEQSSVNCIPMKKRLYIPPTDSECENNESFSHLNLNESDKTSDIEDMPMFNAIASNQMTQKFQITGLHSSKNSNIKVLRLKRVANESQSVFVPSLRDKSDSMNAISSSKSLNIEMETKADSVYSPI